MNRKRNQDSTHPPRMNAGLAILITLAAIVALVAIWLSVDASPTASTTTQPAHHAPTSRRAKPHPPAITPPAATTAPAVTIAGPEDTPAQPTLPIREQQRIQGTTAPPPNLPSITISPAPTPHDWDRSPAAREQAIITFGGTPRTEKAVENGLAWLAAHQGDDGTWDRFGFARQCPRGDRCGGVATERRDHDLLAGITGLSLLAFLGAGYTDRDGDYQPTVARATEALLRLQEPHGGFSRDEASEGYDNALATLALAEYFAMTRDERIEEPLRRAVKRIASTQQALGGWDYGPRPNTGRNDTSITAWMIQALHACRAAGVDVPPRTLLRATLHFSRSAGVDGRVRYADAGEGLQLDRDLRPVYQYSLALTAAGLMAEQLLGWRFTGDVPLRQTSILAGDLPSETRFRHADAGRRQSMYYWYYGTLAMFQRGGEDWEKWNRRLRDALLPLQNRDRRADGTPRHRYGSWPPAGRGWGMAGLIGGRVYSTAIGTLTMEIYYRHTPAFLRDDVPLNADDWREYLRDADTSERSDVLACVRQLRVEIGEPVLLDLLRDENDRLALDAAEALAAIDSPMGIAVMEAQLDSLPVLQKQQVIRSLERARTVQDLPPARGVVRLYDSGLQRATVDLPRSYVGMRLDVRRDGRTIATARVIQRFTARTVAVIELNDVRQEPDTGDTLVESR